jgi:BMFP domain-containing protein YqiC
LVRRTILVHCGALGRIDKILYTATQIHHRRRLNPMALKPPPAPWELLQQASEMVGGSGIKGEVDKSLRALAQSALSRLDMVSREEFDAQTEALQRTRARVAELEATLEEITREVDTLTDRN